MNPSIREGSFGGMRLLGLFLLLGLLVIVPFLIWGDNFEVLFSTEGAVRWLEGHGTWAWAVGMALLIADLFLPIPGTVVMSALGYLYGWLIGGLISAVGSILSGLLAYGMCRALGRSAAERIAGAKDLKKGERLFSRAGGWVVTWSRWLPVLPEVIACLAGMVKMNFAAFAVALICGSVPLGFAFAAIGNVGHISPGLAIAASVTIPPLLWWIASHLMKRDQQDAEADDS